MTTNDNVLTPEEFACWQQVLAAATASGKSADKALHLADLSVAAGRQTAKQAHEAACALPMTPSQLEAERRYQSFRRAFIAWLCVVDRRAPPSIE